MSVPWTKPMHWNLTRKFLLMLTCLILVVVTCLVVVERRLDVVADKSRALNDEWRELRSVIQIDHTLDALQRGLNELHASGRIAEGSQLPDLVTSARDQLADLREIQDRQSGPDIDMQQSELNAIEQIEQRLNNLSSALTSTRASADVLSDDEWDELTGTLLSVKADIDAFVKAGSSEVRDSVEAVRDAEDDVDQIIGVFVAVLVIAVAFNGAFFYFNIIRPIRRLRSAVQQLADRHSHQLRADPRGDELAALLILFHEMSAEIDRFTDDLENQVSDRTRELIVSQKLAAVGRLAAGVAHEINNPMASILACAEGLLRRLDAPGPGLTPEAAREYLETIRNEVRRSKETVGKLLDFSRSRPPHRETVDATHILAETVALARHAAQRAGCAIQLADHKHPIPLLCDRDQVKQVLLNLLLNSIDACATDGAITAAVITGDGTVRFVVEDTGCGFSPEDRDHLFEPFFSRKRGGGGTGLGLAISHGIVEAHGGVMRAESRGPGQGARFEVDLPNQSRSRHALPGAAPASALSKGPRN